MTVTSLPDDGIIPLRAMTEAALREEMRTLIRERVVSFVNRLFANQKVPGRIDQRRLRRQIRRVLQGKV